MGRTVFTTITPIPGGVSRETVLETLHNHIEMIDLNPTHDERVPTKPPPEASPEEYHCKWYQITDKISYLPGVKGSVSFKASFHDLPNGVQIHVYAPMGLDIQEKWTVGGSLPHEPVQPVEIGLGVPITGLYLREDVEMKCNFMVTKFVKKQLKDALAALVARMVVKSQLVEAVHQNRRLTYQPGAGAEYTAPLSPPMSPRPMYDAPLSPPPTGGFGMMMEYPQGYNNDGKGPQLAMRSGSTATRSGSQRNSQHSHYSQQQQGSPQPQYAQPQHSPGMPGQPQYAQPQQSPGMPGQQYAQPQHSPAMQGQYGQPQHSPAGAWQTQNYHAQLAGQKMIPEPQQQHPATIMELDSTQVHPNSQPHGFTAELP